MEYNGKMFKWVYFKVVPFISRINIGYNLIEVFLTLVIQKINLKIHHVKTKLTIFTIINLYKNIL